MKNIVFIADFFKKDLLGGGETNDDVLIKHLISSGYKVKLKKCLEIGDNEFNKNNFFIVGNFVSLSEQNKIKLQKENYIIYEHDHKYIKSRDPSKYKYFIAPEKDITNKDFYKSAVAVVVLSKICKEVIIKNLNIDNVYNIGCSLWSDSSLSYMEELCENKKNQKFAILNSSNPVKNTLPTVEFSKRNNIKYDLINKCPEKELLNKLSTYSGLIFFPTVLETFSRVSAEAKMLNCKLMTKPNMLGFASEEIYKLSGRDLIKQFKIRKEKALNLFVDLIERD